MSDQCGKSCASQKSTCGSAQSAKAMQELAVTRALAKITNKILVMSGKGGVGKSTVAVNLALGLANRGHRVGLMDVDLHGPDVCRMLDLTAPLERGRSGGKLLPPMQFNDNLKVISLEYLMSDRDEAVIWRGPLKVQAIRQFIADIDWGDLDYLVVDAPPGTGDEPLSVAQIIKDVKALIVTTPQEVALADVRKSINFCRQVEIKVVGLVENMSGFLCPHCRESVEIFKTGGGEKTARDFDLPFLGRVPMDPRVVIGGDDGKPFLASGADSPATRAFTEVVANVEKSLPPRRATTPKPIMADCGCGCGNKEAKKSGCEC